MNQLQFWTSAKLQINIYHNSKGLNRIVKMEIKEKLWLINQI